jgi:hypothetical protein
MPELQGFPLVTSSGRKGRVFRASRFLDRSNINKVELDDGTETSVLATDLKVQPDGTFLLDDKAVDGAAEPARETAPAPSPGRPADPAPTATTRIERAAPGGDVMFNEPLFSEDVSVDRVPVNRIISGPAQTRQEGDTTIIPVVEEVITIQKRLLLREEVRITRKRTEIREPRRIRMDGEQDRVVGSDGRDIDLS